MQLRHRLRVGLTVVFGALIGASHGPAQGSAYHYSPRTQYGRMLHAGLNKAHPAAHSHLLRYFNLGAGELKGSLAALAAIDASKAKPTGTGISGSERLAYQAAVDNFIRGVDEAAEGKGDLSDAYFRVGLLQKAAAHLFAPEFAQIDLDPDRRFVEKKAAIEALVAGFGTLDANAPAVVIAESFPAPSQGGLAAGGSLAAGRGAKAVLSRSRRMARPGEPWKTNSTVIGLLAGVAGFLVGGNVAELFLTSAASKLLMGAAVMVFMFCLAKGVYLAITKLW